MIVVIAFDSSGQGNIHTFQHIQSDNIGSAENDKCPILSARLISAEIPDNIGSAEAG